MWYMPLVEKKRLPDPIVRIGIRTRLHLELRKRYGLDCAARCQAKLQFIRDLKRCHIAEFPEEANRQHYEVPADFFKLVLGRRLKYSCCLWPEGVDDLDGAEEAMLRLSCERALLEDGMDVLDLGCGWGSLSFWICEHYPNCRVVAVSNSRLQREYMEANRLKWHISNLKVMTGDMNSFTTERRFDRVMSIEMFEHMKNYEMLLQKIRGFLKNEGRLFVHIFTHREFAYGFDRDNERDWMALNFFAGGTMPSIDLLLYFQRDLRIIDQWCIDGIHYARTLNTWLNKLDAHVEKVRPILGRAYGPDLEKLWLGRWRLFFMACAETFGFRKGQEYMISQYLLEA